MYACALPGASAQSAGQGANAPCAAYSSYLLYFDFLSFWFKKRNSYTTVIFSPQSHCHHTGFSVYIVSCHTYEFEKASPASLPSDTKNQYMVFYVLDYNLYRSAQLDYHFAPLSYKQLRETAFFQSIEYALSNAVVFSVLILNPKNSYLVYSTILVISVVLELFIHP